jgi:ATP-dependent Clp protease, protease subunit
MHTMIIPTVIDSDGRTDRAYDIYSRLLEDRIVYLGEDVNHHTANLIVAQLLFLESKDPNKDITLYINSPGGSVYDGLAIYDTMKFLKCDVSTVGIGMQASMGAFLLSSGTKGKRYVLPNAAIMIHQPSAGTSGKVSDMEIDLKQTIALKKRLHEILAENTGKSLATINKDADRDFWMTAKEAVDYGVADKVIDKR